MYANISEATLAPVLSLIAPLFSYMTEEEYGDAVLNGAWPEARVAAQGLARDEGERARWEHDLALPAWPARSTFQNEVLVAGMPLAALPVESLYKPWSTAPGNAYGAQRGLYLGDSARHISLVYAALELEVPERFSAMPDHLALLLELFGLFLECGNLQAARTLASEHLNWLAGYDEALARKADEAAHVPLLDADQRTAVVQGIAHLRALAALVDRAVQVVVSEENGEVADGRESRMQDGIRRGRSRSGCSCQMALG